MKKPKKDTAMAIVRDLVDGVEAVELVSDDTKDATFEQHQAAYEKLDKAMRKAKALLRQAQKGASK